MATKAELEAAVKKVFADTWTQRDGQKVPDNTDLGLANDAVKLDGTVLYADMADSTNLVDKHNPLFAAEVYKTYLHCAAKVVTHNGGVITAYDGDRIMAVFLGDGKNSAAAKCGLQIKWAVTHVVQPALKAQYPSSPFVLKQTVGIDTSKLMIARTGIRGSNDLVWVGRSANYAAKLSDLSDTYQTYITHDVYSMLNEKSKYSEGKDMWTKVAQSKVGVAVYGSRYHWSLS